MKGLSHGLCPIIIAVFVFSCKDQASSNRTNDTAAIKTDSNWTLTPFVKIDSVNPILQPGIGSFICPVRKQKILWEEKDVFNPAIVVRGDTVFMLYRAQDKVGKPDGTSRIGIAESRDGIHFVRQSSPVLFPDNDSQKRYEWEGGCEDPRIVEDSSGTYYMTYTAYDGHTARLMVASSKDLRNWIKHGPAFAKAYNGKYIDKWSKSGSIVSIYANGEIIATKINGKYWMYWGDQFIWAANSDDLINWIPVEMKASEKPSAVLKGQALNMPELKIVIPTRNKKFDSDLVESGPPAMITEKGILLIYNSRNSSTDGDSSLPVGTYTAGQILLDKNDPTKILQRADHYFFKPDKSYELIGQVNNVCFLEGLAGFKEKWYLYYGTADSKIAVAVK
ncbi:MAG TPA: glycoside hydrolase family 130 protein [Puia sp.]|nr:glycoside hydrolase family 130 protein [Puia sp.]